MSKRKRKQRRVRNLRRANDALRGASTVVRGMRAEIERLREQLRRRPVVYRGPLAWVAAWWRGTLDG